MDTQTDSNPAKVELLYMTEQLCQKFGWASRNRPWTTSALKLRAATVCERSLSFRLSNPSLRESLEFDPAYRAKSDYATVFLLDYLKMRLELGGFNVQLATEVKDQVGKYDVQVVRGDPCLISRGTEPVARIEVKASLGLPLEQISRYLLSPSPLILVRVISGQVVMLRPQQLGSFVDLAAESLVSKAGRLLRGQPYVVAGSSCRGCPDKACPFHEDRLHSSRQFVAMKGPEFEKDLTLFYLNLPGVCERTAQLVIGELNDSGETRG